MTNMDKPEFKLYVRQLFDAVVPSYCVECLGYLWSKRGEAGDTIRLLQKKRRDHIGVSQKTSPSPNPYSSPSIPAHGRQTLLQ